MTGFWDSPLGEITGSEKDSFAGEFVQLPVIPEGTKALATIKSCMVVEAQATAYKDAETYIEVVYIIVSDEYKGREVSQKIKVFSGKPEQIHRHLNMLKRLMVLCNYSPKHNNQPTDVELASLCGKMIGIKISEWAMPKADGDIMEGNFVGAIYESQGFQCEQGVKKEVTHKSDPLDSAFSRNQKANGDDLTDDIPF